METRHNTQALERVLELVMQRHAGLAAVAHAEALREIGRYKWQRLLAWAGSFAIVAIGIGLAAYLFNSRHTTVLVENVPGPKVEVPASKTPDVAPKVEAPVPTKTDVASKIDETPAPKPEKPPIETTNFTIFKTKVINVAGRDWQINAGHNFNTQEDQSQGQWSNAWCYTEGVRDKLNVKFGLGVRQSNSDVQSAASFDAGVAQSFGLSSIDVQRMAAECPWLDGRSFNIMVPPFSGHAPQDNPAVIQNTIDQSAVHGGDSEIVQSPLPESNTNAVPSSPSNTITAVQAQKFLRWQDYDAAGGDMAGMPIRNISLDECEVSCLGNSNCVVATYNSMKRACFLKSSVQSFQRFPGAITLSRPSLREQLTTLANGN